MDSATTQDEVETGDIHRGRPLDNSRDTALREAAMELLAEIGYDRLTIDAIAARAHAGKTTIYRRWSGKAELIVDALSCVKGPTTFADTGSLRGDLTAIAERASSADTQFDAQVMIGLVTALARDAELRQVFRDRFIDSNMSGMKQIFERAVRRGEIPPGRDLDLLMTLFPALVLHRLLLSGELPEANFAERVINEVILPLATAPTHPPARPL